MRIGTHTYRRYGARTRRVIEKTKHKSSSFKLIVKLFNFTFDLSFTYINIKCIYMGNLYGAARRLYVRNTSEYDAQRVALGLMIGDMLCGRIRILDYTNADIVN